VERSDEIVALLTELRDAQRAAIESQAAARSELLAREAEALELQREAVANQKVSLALQERQSKWHRMVTTVQLAFIVFVVFFVATLFL
jgi:pyrroloquinoline quinone (PQQ) biosynthesis protein C